MSRGIVITAGGPLYFLNAYVNVRMLRECHRCELPVAWFYLGAEMRPKWLAEAAALPGVSLHDLGGPAMDRAKGGGGWQSKVEAIVEAPFDEVLFLDADSFPNRDPAGLFDHPAYAATGAVLWQDITPWDPFHRNCLDHIFGVRLPEERIESGQLLFDKRRMMPALKRIRELNERSAQTYQLFLGDTGTWPIGCIQAGLPFTVNPHRCGYFMGGILQPDLDGEPLFQHATGGKFQWDGAARACIAGWRVAEQMIRELRMRMAA